MGSTQGGGRFLNVMCAVAFTLAAAACAAQDQPPVELLVRGDDMGHSLDVNEGFIKAHTGRLTPVCGCAIAAGAGAAAALVRLGGGTPRQAEVAVALLLSSLQGMVCDGAKGSCALKVGTAAAEACTSALLVLRGLEDPQDQGMISSDFVVTARNVGDFSREGLMSADSAIIRILQDMEAASRERS